MTMTIKHLISSALLGTALVFGTVSLAAPAHALSDRLEAFIGSEPPLFATADEGVAAFKAAMATGDIVQISKLLGLDPDKVEGRRGHCRPDRRDEAGCRQAGDRRRRR